MEKFKYKFPLTTPFPEEFTRWLMYEAINVKHWNPDRIKSVGTNVVYFPTFWRITKEANSIIVECNARLWSLRKGIKFNAVKQTVLIS